MALRPWEIDRQRSTPAPVVRAPTPIVRAPVAPRAVSDQKAQTPVSAPKVTSPINTAPQQKLLADIAAATSGIKYTPKQVEDMYNYADSIGRVTNQGTYDIFVKAMDEAVARQGSGGGGGGDALKDSTKRTPQEPSAYSTEGLALSAEFFGALAARRRAADEQLQMALEREQTQTQRLNLAATTAREQTTREFRNLSEDLMQMLGGRGLARAPRFAGRGARRLQTVKDEKFGQISQTLSDEISALQEMVQMAQNARNTELARISQEEALAKTQVAGLLPAAAAFGG
jgi:hypothetical protein